ncbi:MAG: hypothetical protein QME57_01015 [Patescibacteria group bacterium]|nr:hypothetical protein [Patescibacteria group bacterium]
MERLQVSLSGKKEKISALLTDWQEFYRSFFGLKVNLLELKVPESKNGFDRLIVVAQGMTPQRLYNECNKFFCCWKWTHKNLDEIIWSKRTAKDGAYAVWFQDVVEADENLKNLSADELKEKGIPGITLEERFLMGLKYFEETEKHLDVENWTLCSGSRYSNGLVPRVYWSQGFRKLLVVGWCRSDYSLPRLRSRQAVL